MSEIKHFYLHVDLDAFFASVEQLDHPEYRGKPLIVGGMPQDKRSVVSTASYEARKYGVHSAMPVAKAYQLCPQGIYVYPRMKRYSEMSYQIMSIFKDFSPDVQQMSIDEAFIDLTGTEKLFGPPHETALKIKQRVFSQTGLTVSIGLAPTKYLAKIASDMNKPDGLYCIKEGTEQEFMLNLPLNKVWGIGDKTLETLKKSGLRTTRDIYEKTLESLVFMMGNNMGNFLYNVVRGNEVITFDRKTKSHSISNETTFPYDITQMYTIETTILELCHSIIFRLLKENGFSRTVMVKIRYEDFITVSIQQTYPQSVLTLDTLYACARELFEKKYERGRGVRLIGVGLENIENTEKPYQPGLFDDNSEKKQNVEKAILNLKKKHPEININKARILEKGKILKLIIFLFLLHLPRTGITHAQDYQIDGYWKGNLEGNINMSFGAGTPFGISAPLPVLKQEVDLNALINITPAFYFSLQFLDEFKKNTYSLCYDGDKYLSHFKFSNRNITMPSVYSASLNGYGITGGSNEAPGFMLNFKDYKNSRFSADLMLRYDMTQSKSMTFYGSNSVKDINKEPADYVKSNTFVIPSEVISLINGVYIQSNTGNYTDSSGITYRLLNESDYLIIPEQKLLVLSPDTEALIKQGTTPYILITFSSAQACNTLLTTTGAYSNSSSFAGQIQEYFDIDLTQFSTISAASLITQINGVNGFIIQKPFEFSPYLCANKYEFPGVSGYDYIINDRYTGSQVSGYNADSISLNFDFTLSNFFDEKKSYAYVSKGKFKPVQPQYRYPFADKYPQLYLGLKSDSPLVITARSYTAVKEYDIGKNVSAGSVRVYRNGILEPDASYDSGTGFVTLSSPAGELDKIYITYAEESEWNKGGFFTAGAGFVYNLLPTLSLDISYTGMYPFAPGVEYYTPENISQSFSSLTAGITYQNSLLKTYDAVTAAFQNDNISKTLLAVSFTDSHAQTFYHGATAGQELSSLPDLTLYNSLYPVLDSEQECTSGSFTGQTDNIISGYKIPLSYNFEKADASTNLWAAAEIKLSTSAGIFTAQEFEMAFLPDASLAGQNIDVYLVLSSESQPLEEGAAWLITSLSEKDVIYTLDTDKNSWQTVKVRLNDRQRSKLINCDRAKIIIVKTSFNSATDKTTGTLYTGPYKTCSQSMFIKSMAGTDAGGNDIIKTGTTYSKNPSTGETSATLTWELDSIVSDYDKRELHASAFFTPADLSSYQDIDFNFASSENCDLTFILEDSQGNSAVFCKIKNELLQSVSLKENIFHTVSVNLETATLTLDQKLAPSGTYELIINKSIIPCVYKIILNPVKEGQEAYTGIFRASCVYYKNNQPYFSTKNTAGINIHTKNIKFNAVSSQGISINTGSIKAHKDYINTSMNSQVNLGSVLFSADADTSFSSGQNTGFLKNAGHSVKTQNSLFKLLDFDETYRYSLSANSGEKLNYLKLDFSPFKVPLNLLAQTTVKTSLTSSSENIIFGIGTAFKAGKSSYSADTKLNLNGKALRNPVSTSSNYFVRWYELSKEEFSNGINYQHREISFDTKLSGAFPLAQLGPTLSYNLSGRQNDIEENLYETKNQFSLTIPFTTGNSSFTFGLFHKADIQQTLTNTIFMDDLSVVFGKQNQFQYFYLTIPYYSMFDKKLEQNLRNILTLYSLTAISETMQYDISWKRKLFNDFKDIFIPLSASTAVSRDITLTESAAADIYQIKTSLNFKSIKPYSGWYRQLENTGNISTAFKFTAAGTNPKAFSLDAADQLLFYIGDNSQLIFRIEGALSNGLTDSTSNWKTGLNVSWKRDTNESLSLEITKLLVPKLNTEELKTSVNDSINLLISRENEIIKQNYEYLRNAEIVIGTNYSLSSGAGLIIKLEQQKASLITIQYKTGLKISY